MTSAWTESASFPSSNRRPGLHSAHLSPVPSKDHPTGQRDTGEAGVLFTPRWGAGAEKGCTPRAAPALVLSPTRPGMEARELGRPSHNAGGSQMRGPSWCSAQGGGEGGQGEGQCLPVSQPRLLPPGKGEWPPDAARGFQEHEETSEDVASPSFQSQPHPQPWLQASRGVIPRPQNGQHSRGRLRTRRSWPLGRQAP